MIDKLFSFSAGERLQVKNFFHESALTEHPIVSKLVTCINLVFSNELLHAWRLNKCFLGRGGEGIHILVIHSFQLIILLLLHVYSSVMTGLYIWIPFCVGHSLHPNYFNFHWTDCFQIRYVALYGAYILSDFLYQLPVSWDFPIFH